MKQIPILFSTLMVQALLDGRKTMTRRTRRLERINENPDSFICNGRDDDGLYFFYDKLNNKTIRIASPYGKVGDVLWVRESFAYMLYDKFGPVFDSICFKAGNEEWDGKWKPSIHMPKAEARIWLEVVSVRVEQVQDITREDAIAEGIELSSISEHKYLKMYKDYTDVNNAYHSAINSFMSLWESINGRESWGANPWVWVVEFKVLSTNGKPEHL